MWTKSLNQNQNIGWKLKKIKLTQIKIFFANFSAPFATTWGSNPYNLPICQATIPWLLLSLLSTVHFLIVLQISFSLG